ncbi:MAG: DUF4468 domain-containing protein [Chlorobi bacterium]|nr:DUF4468 domain-containing protein [Chlorobiota bacterium]
MKTFLALIFLLSGMQIYAQHLKKEIKLYPIPVDSATRVIRFRNVVDVEGTKDELYKRCVYWLNDFYKDPTRVTTLRDPKSGKIAGRHQFRIYYYDKDSIKYDAGMIRYFFTIEFKDNRYRYTIDKIVLKSNTYMPVERWLNKNDPAYDPRWDDYLQQIARYVDKWSTSLEKKMEPPEKEKPDIW